MCWTSFVKVLRQQC